MPRVSVIIPVYNHAQELEVTLEGLARQTFRDFEVIIVDDGSIKAFSLQRSAFSFPIQLIRFDENRGAPAARNEGFARATGEYIMFLDADVYLEPQALKRMTLELDHHPEIAFVYPSFFWGKKRFPSRSFDREALKATNYIHTSALIRRGAFLGFDESLKRFQDWDLFLTLSQKHKGLWINEYLYRITPRKEGMSRWLPSIIYQMPWPKWLMSGAVRRYREAESVIRRKHGIEDKAPLPNLMPWLILLILVVEALSIPAAWNPIMNSVLALFAGLSMILFAWQAPEYSFGLLVLEFLIGSKGRLFVYGADLNNDGGISLRIVLFLAFFLGWKLARRNSRIKFGLWCNAMILLVVYAVARAVFLEQPFLWVDANAWGALLLVVPVYDLAQHDPKKFWHAVKQAVMIGAAWLVVKTLFLFYVFSHAFDQATRLFIYRVVRRTGVGEITSLSESGLSRVFLQSHIYIVLGAVWLATQAALKKVKREHWAAFALCVALVLITYSRSFWIGLAAGLVACLYFVWQRKSWNWLPKIALASALGLLAIAGVALFPLPRSTVGNPLAGFQARVDTEESAIMSRWELLPVLWEKIKEHPILGSGFGATVTYQSSDPRIVEQTGGRYTTYAFEWGWLDMWIKFGVLGPLVMLGWLISLAKRKPELAPVLIALAVTQIFTPYLNHPLGLLVLILIEALAATLPERAILEPKQVKI